MTKRRPRSDLALRDFRRAVRVAVADYMQSEGCSCCRAYDAHREHASILAQLLRVPACPDGDGYDFSRFRSKP